MSNGLIIILGLVAAMFLIGGVGAVAYRRIKNAAKPGGGVGETLARLRDELEQYDGGKDPDKDPHKDGEEGSRAP